MHIQKKHCKIFFFSYRSIKIIFVETRTKQQSDLARLLFKGIIAVSQFELLGKGDFQRGLCGRDCKKKKDFRSNCACSAEVKREVADSVTLCKRERETRRFSSPVCGIRGTIIRASRKVAAFSCAGFGKIRVPVKIVCWEYDAVLWFNCIGELKKKYLIMMV